MDPWPQTRVANNSMQLGFAGCVLSISSEGVSLNQSRVKCGHRARVLIGSQKRQKNGWGLFPGRDNKSMSRITALICNARKSGQINWRASNVPAAAAATGRGW